jgi:hypothetical protein
MEKSKKNKKIGKRVWEKREENWRFDFEVKIKNMNAKVNPLFEIDGEI